MYAWTVPRRLAREMGGGCSSPHPQCPILQQFYLLERCVWMNLVRWRWRRLWSKGPCWPPCSARWRSWRRPCSCSANASRPLSAGKHAARTTLYSLHKVHMRAPHLHMHPLSWNRPVERFKRRESDIAGIAHRTVVKSIVLYRLKCCELLADKWKKTESSPCLMKYIWDI
jgi:hypothetical protein